MESDVSDTITIKQLLNNSIKADNFDYIKQIINKNVSECNLLYTQVCYLIKLFLLYDYESNNKTYNDYIFNELFIRKCFKLVKTGEIDNKLNDNSLIDRISKFYVDYNSNNSNTIKFTKPINVSSITHITDALSRNIQTNITNNIILNYNKYIREYTNINLTLKFNNIDNKTINNVYNDLYYNTFYSDSIYHLWINEHKKLIIPKFTFNIYIKDFNDGIDNYYNIFIKFISNYVKINQKLKDLITLNNDKKTETVNKIIQYLINKINIIDNKYDNWINENKIIIINEFNSSNLIDLDKKINEKPYEFIPYMLYMNKNLELNNSDKKYQIIPLRTNLTPKFIPIGIDSFVDILDSKYLLGKRKNDYHNDNKIGFVLFDIYFKFDSKYIKNTIKKGYKFSSISTNGYEINYIFNSKKYESDKKLFHSKGKDEKKSIKEKTKNMTNGQIDEFIKKHKENKEINKKEKDKLNKETNKIKKHNKTINYNQILKNNEIELNELKKNYTDKLIEIEKVHYINLKLEFDKIDKTNKDNKKIMDELLNKYNDIFVSNNVYLKHEYDRNYLSLINDYNNTIDIKYNEIKNKDMKNNNLIKELNDKILKIKNELKIIKKEKFNNINKEYKKELNFLNFNINDKKNNKKTLKRLISKIKIKTELLNYETTHYKALTFNHILKIINILINLITKIQKMEMSVSLNNYLNNFGDINVYFYQISNEELKQVINMCLKYISIDVFNINQNDIIKLLNIRITKIEKIENIKDNEYKNKHNTITSQLNELSLKLNKLINKKRKIEKEMINLFKVKNNEITKVDNMSKKTLSILNKINWVVIDPGINSLLTMMSKDGKTKMSYTKCHNLNKTKRKEILKKIEKIKKEKIIKLENKLTKDKLRLKTSNIYINFNEYFKLKMEIHNEITKLYNDDRLNKLSWYAFINKKRSEDKLINNIKKKFGSDIVLIMGDWSMNKSHIKSISTPNKKYEILLNKNFPMLKIDEFRTSIIENKSGIKCENLIKEIDYEKMNIKSVYSLEKLKEKNIKKYNKVISNKKVHKILTCKISKKLMKYINRDTNAVKNMILIVSSYIKNNIKPKTFVLGTKIGIDG